MADFCKFLSIKNQLQKIYNYKAKEEREIIYAIKMNLDQQNENSDTDNKFTNDNLTRKDETKITSYDNVSLSETNKQSFIANFVNDLILITHIKDLFYIEFLRIDKDIKFKFSSNVDMLYKLTVKTSDELGLRIGDKEFDVKFDSATNLKEFAWCLIKVFYRKKLEGQVQVKGVNHKDLEDFAQKNNFQNFNKIFEAERKKERYEVDVTDRELQDLEYTLKSLNIDSILNYDMENLNSKIEQFNISTKEGFLQRLQGDFAKDVSYFLGEIKKLDEIITNMNDNIDSDLDSIAHIWNGIQKIEDANHRIELRNENKRKLQEFMIKLLEQLTISQSKEENLLRCRYLSNSELIIVNEILDNFVKFYKSRKKQDIKMSLIKEGHEKIKQIVDLMIKNFNQNIYEYIKTHQFKETFLLKNMPSFNNTKLIILMKENLEKMKKNRNYLENFILDRKFFIEKLNILVNNQDDLNKTKMFKDCTTIMAKGMRDALSTEFNYGIKILQIFFDSEILNPEKLDIYLNSDDLLNYDALARIDSDYTFEINKYFTTFILNCFFSADKCMEILQNFFSEEPNFLLDKTSKYSEEIEKIVTQKIYEFLGKNFYTSLEKNILLGLVIYCILAAVQDKISKNVIEDMIIFSVKDIFEQSYKIEESFMPTVIDHEPESMLMNTTFHHHLQTHNYNVNIEEAGIRKISMQETKNFISKNMKTLQGTINLFFNEQKQLIIDYTCDTRRIGVIPMVKKTINLVKLLLAFTKGIKQDYIFEIINDIKLKSRALIEKLAKIKPKYSNIILLENYYYLNITYRSFENYNITHPQLTHIEQDSFKIYLKIKEEYIREIFEYQFKDFSVFYEKFNSQYITLGDQIKMQSTFTFNNFDRITGTFLRDLPRVVEKMARRINKHLCRELGLAPVLWIDVQNYLSKTVNNLESIFKNCYGKSIDSRFVSSALEVVTNFNFMSIYKK